MIPRCGTSVIPQGRNNYWAARQADGRPCKRCSWRFDESDGMVDSGHFLWIVLVVSYEFYRQIRSGLLVCRLREEKHLIAELHILQLLSAQARSESIERD